MATFHSAVYPTVAFGNSAPAATEGVCGCAGIPAAEWSAKEATEFAPRVPVVEFEKNPDHCRMERQ